MRANETKDDSMSDDRLPAIPFKSEAGDAAQRATWSDKFEHAARPSAATRRTVGVYERPAARTGLSLPVIVILILATLISLVLSVRFLF
jgi:hypothetical protein